MIEAIVARAQTTRNGFKDLQLAADEVIEVGDVARSKDVALQLLRSEVHQARCVGTFILGRLAAGDRDALAVLKRRVSQDDDWRVQEILAKAFDRFCTDTGYQAALPTIREWLSAASANTRRAVTEGLRIWTGRPYFRDHPEAAVALLAPLRTDDSDYLRKSVGNALRDISKKHPDLIRKEVATWSLDQPGVRQVHQLATRLLTSGG
ncbi:DNA alkylation repair protein [Rhodopseudomonas sp. HC1]|uniref:DNA alkylation repair protein n=1 Tax=Rhodopseudomonas infernalis TaxID=2897386 RepID=UPI001EE87CA5|nr:DNA alkylation repair protein [Rhodopseudomonas infernalis]MCG6205122.1 DNA alkylation repair protein [Rhodopseudomonas infernalis]